MQANAIPSSPGMPPGGGTSAREAVLRARAQELEAAFLSEMLGHAGLGSGDGTFGGGIGEEQFASFLRDEQAKAMVKAGGIGLAESIFHALAKQGTPNADR